MKLSCRETWTLVLFASVLFAATAGLCYLAATTDYKPVACYDSVRRVMLLLMLPLLGKYVFQLVCAPLYTLIAYRREKRNINSPRLSVSVLIPAWNEQVGIVKTIRSVLSTRYPDLQIVVINDGSTDSTHEKITQFLADYTPTEHEGTEICYLSLPNGGKANAMNSALPHATGEIVVTIDADSVMDPDAIAQMVKHFHDPLVGGVAGNVIIDNRKKPIEWIQQMEYLYGFFFKRTDSVFDSVYIIGGAAAAYRRKVLEEMGGFDHTIITEDIEMSTRILSHGYKTRYACDAVIYTEGPSNFSGLCNQRLRWKYGRILTFVKHRRLFFSLRSGHNPYLTFIILPIAVYAEVLLLMETVMLSIFLVYTVRTSDYAPLIGAITLLTAVVGIQILVDSKIRHHRNLLLLAPSAWLLFYAVDLIELQALIRSLKRIVTRKELRWQKWVRIGVLTTPA